MTAELGALRAVHKPQGNGGREMGSSPPAFKRTYSNRLYIPSLDFPTLSPLGILKKTRWGEHKVLEVGSEGGGGKSSYYTEAGLEEGEHNPWG